MPAFWALRKHDLPDNECDLLPAVRDLSKQGRIDRFNIGGSQSSNSALLLGTQLAVIVVAVIDQAPVLSVSVRPTDYGSAAGAALSVRSARPRPRDLRSLSRRESTNAGFPRIVGGGRQTAPRVRPSSLRSKLELSAKRSLLRLEKRSCAPQISASRPVHRMYTLLAVTCSAVATCVCTYPRCTLVHPETDIARPVRCIRC